MTWSLLYSGNSAGTDLATISLVDVPPGILAVKATSQTAKPTWFLAARITAKVSTPGALPLGFDSASFTHREAVPIGDAILIQLPTLAIASNYAIAIDPPIWLTQLFLEIWHQS